MLWVWNVHDLTWLCCQPGLNPHHLRHKHPPTRTIKGCNFLQHKSRSIPIEGRSNVSCLPQARAYTDCSLLQPARVSAIQASSFPLVRLQTCSRPGRIHFSCPRAVNQRNGTEAIIIRALENQVSTKMASETWDQYLAIRDRTDIRALENQVSTKMSSEFNIGQPVIEQTSGDLGTRWALKCHLQRLILGNQG